MTPLESRLTLMVDEWLWIGLVVWLYLHFARNAVTAVQPSRDGQLRITRSWARADLALWWAVVLIGAAIIYGIGYPMHWRLEREWQGGAEVSAITILARAR